MQTASAPRRASVPLAKNRAPQPAPRDDVAVARDAAERCACVTAGFFRVNPEALFRETRGSAGEAFARQVWMGGLVMELGFSSGLLGKAIGRDPATIDHACRIIEALRGGMNAEDLSDILGASGVQEFLGGEDRVEAFITTAERVLDDLYAAFVLVAVRGSAYCREQERLKELQR